MRIFFKHMMRGLFFVSTFCTVGLVTVLFRIKHEVMGLDKTIYHAGKVIHGAKEDIALLNSEMCLLTTPGRIHALTKAYLPEWKRVQCDQFLVPGRKP